MTNHDPHSSNPFDKLEYRMTRLERIVLGDAEAKQPGLFELLGDLKKSVDGLKLDWKVDRAKLFAVGATLSVVFTVIGWAIATFHK